MREGGHHEVVGAEHTGPEGAVEVCLRGHVERHESLGHRGVDENIQAPELLDGGGYRRVHLRTV
ncbi:hypothetical protein [Mycolicibacterium sp. CBMA 361]|uniref:hypothetical protein n=1 Tax=Mycolicibacterium sp. CBMA 361 TaxID=2606610 RepID=UPI001EEFEAE5|nr:hypothetical protein [Mycolicibacterium sp. CBMA 361]